MKGLYIHIPFCKSICSYCDFPKLTAKQEMHGAYIDRLLEELASYGDALTGVDTVYFGGGTPNAVEVGLLKKLFFKLKDKLTASVETTIELNPELINEKLVDVLREYHITRVSLGVQTVHPRSLALLNRRHTAEDVTRAVWLLKSKGIHNINLDFMFGLPDTDLSIVERDLDFALSLPITHISYYSLIIEDRTVLKYRIDKKEIQPLEDDWIADMYERIVWRLRSAGFHHYEISNFSLPGYESKHNLLYWDCEEYVGAGSSACGYLRNIRYQNPPVVLHYLRGDSRLEEHISLREAKKEFFLLGLRKIDGISKRRYVERFHSTVEADFDLKPLYDKQLIEEEGDCIRICRDKIFVANQVFKEFVGD